MSAAGERRARAGERGATLLEMMVALAILALVIGLSFPALRAPLAALSVDGARGALAADLRAARSQAVRSGEPVAFQLAADGRGWSWTGGRRALAAPLRVETETGAVTFAGDGGAAAARFVVRGPHGRSRPVELMAPTGVVRAEGAR